MDPAVVTSVTAFLILCGIVGGAMVGWYLRGYFPEPRYAFPRVRDEPDPSDSAGA